MTKAGTHLIIEVWDGEHYNDIKIIEQILIDAVKACDATLLNIQLHKFSPEGISGVAILQESHISIHTWKEYNYIAIDIFVCNSIDPYKAIPVIKEGFKTNNIQIIEIKRGLHEDN